MRGMLDAGCYYHMSSLLGSPGMWDGTVFVYLPIDLEYQCVCLAAGCEGGPDDSPPENAIP
jgi:hypothetical protein